MKKILNIFIVLMSLSLTQCFEEKERIVMITPTDDIQEKLKELRELQREVDDEGVESTNLQAEIDNLIFEINNLVAPNNVPITYSIGIISAASTTEVGVSDATVTMNIDGQLVTATSDSDGQVVFQNLRSGVATVYITVPGYTDVSFVVDLLVDAAASDDFKATGEDFNVSSAIALYPTTLANGAFNLNGNLYFDPDRTDDIALVTDPDYGIVNFFDFNTFGDVQPYRPAPVLNLTDGVFVSETQSTLDAREQSWELLTQSITIFGFCQPDAFHYSFVPVGTAGNIILAIYEEMFVSTTSNTDGSYQLIVPKSDLGNTFRIHMSEFLGSEDYFRVDDFITASGTSTFTTRTREVVFTALYGKHGDILDFAPGTSNNFDQSQVNNFSLFVSNSDERAYDFYFGAKTRDE